MSATDAENQEPVSAAKLENCVGDMPASGSSEDIGDAKNGACDAEKMDHTAEQPAEESQSLISFTVHHGRQAKYPVEFGENRSVLDLKQHLQTITDVPVKNQKLIHNSRQLRDEQTLTDCRLCAGAKVMLVGSTDAQVAAASKVPTSFELAAETLATVKKEPLCKQKAHEKVVKSGPPEDAMFGIRNVQENLPTTPLTGMRNKHNQPVRLTFKLELDQVWIGTAERTAKVPMGTISNVVSEPIENHEQYHIVGLHVGSTEMSIIWFYWVPAQYVSAIKRTILG